MSITLGARPQQVLSEADCSQMLPWHSEGIAGTADKPQNLFYCKGSTGSVTSSS